MPFAPLPAEFLSIVQKLANRPHVAVDLGCGDGAFAALPGVRPLRFVGVDRLGPPAAAPAVVGDALAPPLRPGGCDLVLAANLVHHLAPRRADFSFLRVWADLLNPHGALFVFEDAPRGPDGPAGNYGRLQDFLAAVAPDTCQ